ncbi:MAG: M20 family metallopeptidase [Elsteraceae bacterium]
MTRAAALDSALHHFDSGAFLDTLARRVAIPTESQEPERKPELRRYLVEEITPALKDLGCETLLHDAPDLRGGPYLTASRIEDPKLPTVLTYGHGDVIRGQAGRWGNDRDPWTISIEGDRVYGRGTADNKGQHSINMASLAAVLGARGKLGFNLKILIEMGEEIGSPGLKGFCAANQDLLKADFLLASDGPRLASDRPTLFMGSRGAMNFDLTLELRDGAHHSGNWGGLLSNPGAILANALSCLIDQNGKVLCRGILPDRIPNSVRAALADCAPAPGEGEPVIDVEWGEPGLTPAERVFAWNTFEILAFECGNPRAPVNAIPGRATAHCQVRFVADTDPTTIVPAIRAHLKANGFGEIQVSASREAASNATRLDPEHPVVEWAARSVEASLGRAPARLPNLGGTLPNDCFSDTLSLPTIWVPHSYAGCRQHAPDEHALKSIMREGMAMMTGLFWDLGEAPPSFS